MADYTQPDVVQKRVRFFDGQFLQDQDFIDEQRYHLDRERRQSKLLRVTGITEGLTVTSAAAYRVTVAKGMAVDDLGRQLVLAADLDVRLTDKFAKQQNIELRLIYQETPTDVAQTGGKSARRWDESPKISALAPDGTVAVAPDGASPTWDGPTVLLAKLAVADNGAVTVDATAAPRAGLSVPGAVGIGTTNPAAKLEVSGGGGTGVDLVVNGRLRSNNNDGGLWIAGDRFVGGHTTDRIGFWNGNAWRLTVLPNGNVGIGTSDPENSETWEKVVDIQSRWNAKLSLRATDKGIDSRVMVHDGGVSGAPAGMIVGTKSNHALSFVTNAATQLSIAPTGNVGIGTTGPPWKLSVSSPRDHLALYREAREKSGGAYVFLELAQIDSSPPGVPEVFPCIRFNHHNRFAHRIEGRGSGVHFKTGDPARDDYSDIRAANVTATGRLEVSGNVGIGTSDPENAEGWAKVVDILSRWNIKLSMRAEGIDSRVMVHSDGIYGAPAGMIVGTKSNHALSFVTNAATRLSIAPTGNVGIGTSGSDSRLTVSASRDHVQLRREKTETTGGTQYFLELFQDDAARPVIPEVNHGIHFRHHNRFSHLIEAQDSGFHFKDTNPAHKGRYSDLKARNIYVTDQIGIGTITGIPNHPLIVSGNLGVNKGLIRMGRIDDSSTKKGEVLGGIGFIGMGVQHGQLSFRAGHGFELVDQSDHGPNLDYERDSKPYADLKVRDLTANKVTGTLSQPCSIAFKEEVETLKDGQLSRLYHDSLRTDVVTYRYKGSGLQDRRSLGVIAERCPEYMVDPGGISVNPIEYAAMLHGAVKILADRIDRLEEALAADLAFPDDRGRPDRNRPRPPHRVSPDPSTSLTDSMPGTNECSPASGLPDASLPDD